MPSREENISSLAAAVQHNFRRTQLLPSREENINSLAAAVQHNFRLTLLLPSREENINSPALRYSITSGARCYCHLGKRISIAWALRYNTLVHAAGAIYGGKYQENIDSLGQCAAVQPGP